MAFGCEYTVELFVGHKFISAIEISSRLPTFTPYKATSVGDVGLTLRSGEKRLASISVWATRLHQNDLHSDDVDINEFLAGQLPILQDYKDIFRDLTIKGEVRIEVHLKLKGSYHTAFVLNPDVIKTLGELGICLDVEISYFPDSMSSSQ